ncbi:hypothetical protein ZIOFF_028581 [Zingiber officinale]|uniref:S1 motif domain-containing protein n=1 Tax=Zingiber officinale TaxID=94328 RepID=A0A8J5GVA7_ZINOF|nr:hypothetical protein ZIOFF_028581 [Zingiber officinale]
MLLPSELQASAKRAAAKQIVGFCRANCRLLPSELQAFAERNTTMNRDSHQTLMVMGTPPSKKCTIEEMGNVDQEENDPKRAEYLLHSREKTEVELISCNSKGFVVSFGSLLGFLPYRHLGVKWKFLLYRQNLRIVSSFDQIQKYSVLHMRPKELVEEKRSLMVRLSIGDVKCHIKKIAYFGIFVEVEGDGTSLGGKLEATQADVGWADVELLIEVLQKIEGASSLSKGHFFKSRGLTSVVCIEAAARFYQGVTRLGAYITSGSFGPWSNKIQS